MRCIGHKKKVIIIQFLKWWKNTGEYKISKEKWIKNYYKIYLFGREGWHGFENLIDEGYEGLFITRDNPEIIFRNIHSKKFEILLLDQNKSSKFENISDLNDLTNRIKEIPFELRYDKMNGESKIPLLKTIKNYLVLSRKIVGWRRRHD